MDIVLQTIYFKWQYINDKNKLYNTLYIISKKWKIERSRENKKKWEINEIEERGREWKSVFVVLQRSDL